MPTSRYLAPRCDHPSPPAPAPTTRRNAAQADTLMQTAALPTGQDSSPLTRPDFPSPCPPVPDSPGQAPANLAPTTLPGPAQLMTTAHIPANPGRLPIPTLRAPDLPRLFHAD